MTHETAENEDRYEAIYGFALDENIHSFHMWAGSALKYAWRFPRKGGIHDLRKMLDCLNRSLETLGDLPLARKTMSQLKLFKQLERLGEKLSEVIPSCNTTKQLVANCETPAGYSAGLHAAVLVNVINFSCTYLFVTTRHPGDTIDEDALHLMESCAAEIDNIIKEIEKRGAEQGFLDIRGQSRLVRTLDEVRLKERL